MLANAKLEPGQLAFRLVRLTDESVRFGTQRSQRVRNPSSRVALDRSPFKAASAPGDMGSRKRILLRERVAAEGRVGIRERQGFQLSSAGRAGGCEILPRFISDSTICSFRVWPTNEPHHEPRSFHQFYRSPVSTSCVVNLKKGIRRGSTLAL